MSPPPGRTIRNFRLAAPEFRSAVDHHVLHRFALVHALVGNEGEIVFFASRTSKYPEMPTGAATRHLLAHCRRDIPLDLQTMLREAIETRKRVRRERLRVDIGNGNVQRVSLTAEPFNGKSAAEPLYTIVFDDEGAVVSREDAMVLLENNRLDASPQVERDLGDTRERPQSLVDECETAMEELISFNEFGRELIEKPLSHTLDARATLAFGADGIVCTIGIPYAAAEAETPAQSLETQ